MHQNVLKPSISTNQNENYLLFEKKRFSHDLSHYLSDLKRYGFSSTFNIRNNNPNSMKPVFPGVFQMNDSFSALNVDPHHKIYNERFVKEGARITKFGFSPH